MKSFLHAFLILLALLSSLPIWADATGDLIAQGEEILAAKTSMGSLFPNKEFGEMESLLANKDFEGVKALVRARFKSLSRTFHTDRLTADFKRRWSAKYPDGKMSPDEVFKKISASNDELYRFIEYEAEVVLQGFIDIELGRARVQQDAGVADTTAPNSQTRRSSTPTVWEFPQPTTEHPQRQPWFTYLNQLLSADSYQYMYILGHVPGHAQRVVNLAAATAEKFVEAAQNGILYKSDFEALLTSYTPTNLSEKNFRFLGNKIYYFIYWSAFVSAAQGLPADLRMKIANDIYRYSYKLVGSEDWYFVNDNLYRIMNSFISLKLGPDWRGYYDRSLKGSSFAPDDARVRVWLMRDEMREKVQNTCNDILDRARGFMDRIRNR